ncbi:hypothetical protein [Pseudomonas veronii]|uniref:hypothetical protein n=1 Tax=Pseudomonas veronii TaxID=76761 RepID=UPI000625C3EB|nr:hypothetical protein [Pseudomonas veronii]
MQDLLTEEDREWLHGMGLNLSTWRELTCAKLKGVSSAELMSIARDGCVYRDGAWVNAGNIAEEVAKSITWNAQIFEAWNYGFASKIHAICATMTSFDADILLIATGFKNQDLNELSRSSTDAVAEAYRELYDEGENEEDEDEDDENDHYYESGGGGGGGGHDEEELVDTVVDEPDVNEVS